MLVRVGAERPYDSCTMGPAGADDSLGAAPRPAGYRRQIAGALPATHPQPPATKLMDGVVNDFAVPASTSATHSDTPAGVVEVKRKCLPSRVHPPDDARRPVSVGAAMARVRLVAISNTRSPILPAAMWKYASRLLSRDHCG